MYAGMFLLDSEDDFCLGSLNISYNQQLFSELLLLGTYLLLRTYSNLLILTLLMIPVTGFLISVNTWNKTFGTYLLN